MGTEQEATRRGAGEAAAEGAGRLYRLEAQCPGCGARPALRVTQGAIADAALRAPGERFGTYQCHRRHCGRVFDIRVSAIQNAS